MTPREVATAFFDKLVSYTDEEIQQIVDVGNRILAEREAEAERKLAEEIKQKESELAELRAKVKKQVITETKPPAATRQQQKRNNWLYR